jgi:uncharacterized metal-binding protein
MLTPKNTPTVIEGEHYMQWTRLEEVMGYARGMGYRKIGIAHCVELTREDRVLGHNPAVALYSNYYRRKLEASAVTGNKA